MRQVLGEVVAQLRKMTDHSTANELLSFLYARVRGSRWAVFEYLDAAFLQQNSFMYSMRPQPLPPPTEQAWRELIDEHREAWQSQRLPRVMRLRDYFSFMQFANEERVEVIVCGAHPASGRWIGAPGVRCYGGRLPIPTTETAPNAGLLAADPSDPRLVAMLGLFDPPLSYGEYVERLGRQGLRVLPAEAGYLVEDEWGNRWHDSYRLHGVYDQETHESVWIHPRAERLRAALNRHLGSELVLVGPHDDWQLRNDRKAAGPTWGPQPPAIEFDSDQRIANKMTVQDLAERWFYGRREGWKNLYPHHPLEDAS